MEDKKKFDYLKIKAAVEEEYQRVRSECNTEVELMGAIRPPVELRKEGLRDICFGVYMFLSAKMKKDK